MTTIQYVVLREYRVGRVHTALTSPPSINTMNNLTQIMNIIIMMQNDVVGDGYRGKLKNRLRVRNFRRWNPPIVPVFFNNEK